MIENAALARDAVKAIMKRGPNVVKSLNTIGGNGWKN